MKVPVYDAPQVAPSELPGARVSLDSREAFGGQVGQALEQAGAREGQLEGQVVSEAAEANKKADDARVTQALTAYQGSANSALENVRQARGESALGASQDAYGNLDKEQENISEKLLQNEDQRREFSQHVGRIQVEAKKQIEEHVGQQVLIANEATAAAHASEGLRAVANDYKNESVSMQQYSLVNDSIRKLQRSPAEGDAKMQAFRADLSKTRIDSALAAGDWEFAQHVFDATREEFGDKGSALQQRITVKRNEVGGDAQAQKLVAAHLDDNGRPIEGAIWADVDKEQPGEYRRALETAVQSRISRQLRSYDQAEGDRLGRVVTSVEQSGGQLDQSTEDFQALSPANKAKALERRNTLLRTDRGEQRELDRQELARFSSMAREDQATIDVTTQFPSASPTARFQMQALQKNVKTKLSKGDLEPLGEFDKQVTGAALQLKMPKNVAGQLKANMDAWYLERQRENNGKGPTRNEVSKEIAAQLQHKDGFLGFGSQYRFQAENPSTFQPKGDQPYAPIQARTAPAAPAAPQAFVDTVTSKFQSLKHRAPTPQEIQALYAKHGKRP